MTETPLEQVIEEQPFVRTLERHAEVFFRLSNTLLEIRKRGWTKKHYFQLINEANDVESLLDDHGARFNRTFSFLTELVASLRGFAQVGYSLCHLRGRLESYGVERSVPMEDREGLTRSVQRAADFTYRAVCKMLEAARSEAVQLGMRVPAEILPEAKIKPPAVRQKLPRNVGEEEINDEQQKIAEVASKFLQACDMLEQLKVRRIEDPAERRRFLAEVCTEEQARVYEATVHNLQSAYDTYIKNTVLEGRDEHLPSLRGHASVALHMLEAVTGLAHFYERHENDIRSEAAKTRIAELVDREEVQDTILNDLLLCAYRYMDNGRGVAGDLLREYTNVQELDVELDGDLVLHARPAALIVGIVNHYGTPVEMEVQGQRCNAGSILELLVTVGSHPDERRFVFRGDENPLRDIALLFEFGLAENGIESLPEELSYLRSS